MQDNNKAFSISYSGASKEELELYKEKYTPREYTEKMKKLRAYDRNVDFFSTMISIALGVFGSVPIILGTIFIIKPRLPAASGILMVIFGVIIVSLVPIIHLKIYGMVKKYYSPKILELIKEIEANQG